MAKTAIERGCNLKMLVSVGDAGFVCRFSGLFCVLCASAVEASPVPESAGLV
jgi:hypothetical protein